MFGKIIEKVKVSIPFKRESVSELKVVVPRLLDNSSVSIPFKRESVSELRCVGTTAKAGITVSIPFKRESVSEHDGGEEIQFAKASFNSLQTGKRI